MYLMHLLVGSTFVSFRRRAESKVVWIPALLACFILLHAAFFFTRSHSLYIALGEPGKYERTQHVTVRAEIFYGLELSTLSCNGAVTGGEPE
jgi:hypothetical protein